MNLNLLKSLLSIPSTSRHEIALVEFIRHYVDSMPSRQPITFCTDELNNVFIRQGSPGPVTCLAAHLDTVHPIQNIEIVEKEGMLYAVDGNCNPAGCGGDDKTGVYICLQLLERFDNLSVTLFSQEETGCVGASNAPRDWFDQIGSVIEFDCPGRGLVSSSSGGVPLFEDDSEFIEVAGPVLRRHGYDTWQNHPYTDVKALRQRFEFPCLNLSCGYHNWHRNSEYVVIAEVEAALDAGASLIQALGCRRYRFSDRPSTSDRKYQTKTPLLTR